MKPPLQHLKDPAAIAFSGGGDSTALLHACANHPCITHAFIIDHALRPGSAEEVETAAQFARSLGYKVKIKTWVHDGPKTGIQVKARVFRYTAMGQMCRDAGIKHLITGHTADDQAETLLMRLDRNTGWRGLAGMRETTEAPLWPALHSVILHRPWLDKSRAELRAYNAVHNLAYIDDPSNENQDFARVRARQALAADQSLRSDLLAQQKVALSRLRQERREMSDWLSRFANISSQGFVETSSVPSAELLLHILNSVSGGGNPIDAAKRQRLAKALAEPGFAGTTLAGAWALKTSDGFVFTRDMVAVKGRRNQNEICGRLDTELEPERQCLWDGRFLIQAGAKKITIKPAFGNMNKFRQATEIKALNSFISEVRACLPVYFVDETPLGFGSQDTEKVCASALSVQRLHRLA